LKPLGRDSDRGDVFFRAADVVGMTADDPGEEGVGLKITASGRNSHGHRTFWMAPEDEVSFILSRDHQGKPCASQIRKERKGAWRSGREERRGGELSQQQVLKDQVKRLMAMDADEVLQNASLFKEVLESPEFNPSHLYKVVALLSTQSLVEDTRSDPLYRIFLESRSMQTSLRTTILNHGAGSRHSGTFLEDCLRLIMELVMRSACPGDLRGQLPLSELVDALDVSVREGGSTTTLTEDIVQMLLCLRKQFPDEAGFDRVLGARAPRKHLTVAEDAAELLEADHYEDMPVLPTSAEMLGQCAFEIAANMRTYENCEDYIQTHFMLLREDYIEPLRNGIRDFMKGTHSSRDLHVYNGVKVQGILSTWEGLVYRIELPKKQIRSINWEKSKQLMYGSLLCLSDDKFETLLWATVWRRDEHLIASEGHLDVRIPYDPFDDRLCPGKTFTVIENVTIYFEAYRHVLNALQHTRPSSVPFQHALLSVHPEPHAPGFVTPECDIWHFHNVFASCVKPDCQASFPSSFSILQEWPAALGETLNLDKSQLDAMQHALTHELALIQGPPGTGKTFVGLKVVQALLENTVHTRRSPILVVCYTNHALDQFLEGIFNFCGRIARIGSRSKSEQMKERNLKELVNEISPSREYFSARRSLMDRRDTLRAELARVLQDVDKQTVFWSDMLDLATVSQLDGFLEGYRDYLGGTHNAYQVDDVDGEVWDKIVKEWLQTSDPAKIGGSLIPKEKDIATGKTAKEVFGGWEELANDAEEDGKGEEEEEEAENMKNDRQLDDNTEKKDATQPTKGDLHIELKNPWLPTLDEHLSRCSFEARSLRWQDEDLWLMPLPLRRETYRRWLLEAHHETRGTLPELAWQLERNAEHRATLERERKLALLREMDIVGMTTTAVSKYQQLLKELRPEIVVVEEAAEVLEAHILTALHGKTQQVVLIGDHQQLRPSTAVYRLSKLFQLDVSLFERLIKNGSPHVTLQQQRRMNPKISRLMKPLYPQLRDHSSTEEYPEVMGVVPRCFFLSHSYYEDDEGASHSKGNSFEAELIAALASHLVRQGYSESQITVLSPYLGQVRTLKNKLRDQIDTSQIYVTAVDNFQGEENDIILISLVRSNRTKTMGFLAVENRINVALTRAKHGMFIVGNASMLTGHSLWSKIIAELKTDNCIGDRMPLRDEKTGSVFHVQSAEDIEVFFPKEDDDAGNTTAGRNRRGPGAKADVPERWAGLGRDEEKRDSGKGAPKKNGKGKNGGKGKGHYDRYDDGPSFGGGGATSGYGCAGPARTVDFSCLELPAAKDKAESKENAGPDAEGGGGSQPARGSQPAAKGKKKKQQVLMKWG